MWDSSGPWSSLAEGRRSVPKYSRAWVAFVRPGDGRYSVRNVVVRVVGQLHELHQPTVRGSQQAADSNRLRYALSNS